MKTKMLKHVESNTHFFVCDISIDMMSDNLLKQHFPPDPIQCCYAFLLIAWALPSAEIDFLAYPRTPFNVD